jgi:hypothetical protein
MCTFNPLSYFLSQPTDDQDIELNERNQLNSAKTNHTNPPNTAQCPILKETVRCCINRPQCLMLATGLLACGTGIGCVCCLKYGNWGSVALAKAPKALGITGATCFGGSAVTQTGMSGYGFATGQGGCYYPDITGYCNY